MRRRVCAVFFVLHFALLLAICLRETFWLLARVRTISPPALAPLWAKAEDAAGFFAGKELDYDNPIRQILGCYPHLSGIESGYGFFAPNVADSYRLLFELHYPDGHVEYDLPRVGSSASGLRLVSLLDKIANTEDKTLRGAMVQLLSYAICQEHPGVTMVRAIFASTHFPSPGQFQQGEPQTYQFVFSYDFKLGDAPTNSQPR